MENKIYDGNEEVADKIREREIYLDKIQGSLLGGAVGDALGYPVEFLSLDAIRETFGEAGITSYKYNSYHGKALISDDTQMTLFTAMGILYGDTRMSQRGGGGSFYEYVYLAYCDWLKTQEEDFEEGISMVASWLMDIPELFDRRAPGNTCIFALKSGKKGSIDQAINNSKGCGGVMRVAPLALYCNGLDVSVSPEEMVWEGAGIAAITHGHSLGYMPAGMLVYMIHQLVFKDADLLEAIQEAKIITQKVFQEDPNLDKLIGIVDRATEFAYNSLPDEENIRNIGEGWVAEETLAIAVYCSLRYQNDFSKAITAAVNHSGDSDSTGAVTGNIVGAISGYHAIEEKWKEDLELKDIILEVAADLCHHCQMSI